MRLFPLLAALALAACATAPGPPAPALANARLGLVVATLDGRELVAINADQRFTPASNTKLFTVAAVLNTLRGLEKPNHAAAASLYEEVVGDGPPPNLIIYGRGDPALGDGPQCQANCLAELADAVRDYGFAEVGDVIGDDTFFPDERWGGGWSWNNLETRSGTAISALSVNDNELALRVAPGASVGAAPIADFREGDDLYVLGNDAVTVESGAVDLWIEHRPNTPTARLYGTIPLGSAPQVLALGVDDPALLAAKRLARLLKARGIKVAGDPIARHRPVAMSDDPAKRSGAAPTAPAEPYGPELARLTPAPLAGDIPFTLKQSQNLHAELMLRRLGAVSGSGSAADGIAVIDQMLLATGASWEDG
jgi:D-alanyl-D-alanine carboxypeptidase/D-alanyl-D-alanine-endopeptidase (penicillin-binding protein 4)